MEAESCHVAIVGREKEWSWGKDGWWAGNTAAKLYGEARIFLSGVSRPGWPWGGRAKAPMARNEQLGIRPLRVG